MKYIVLHTAALDNGGTRCEAGTVMAIGKARNQIDADRAQALVANGGAAEEAAAK